MRSRQTSHTNLELNAKQQKNTRLAQALRDNLHRRKAQARARTDRTALTIDKLTDKNGQNKP